MGKITQELATEQEARDVAEAARESDWVEPSFLRELFLGRFRLDLIHPFPPENDAEERRMRGRSWRSCARSCDAVDSDAIDRDGQHSRGSRAGAARHRRVRHQDSRASTAGSGSRR